MHKSPDDAPLLPGLKPVLELLRSRPAQVDLVFCKKGLRGPESAEIQQLCRCNGIRFSLVDAPALDRLVRTAKGGSPISHQGVVARLAVTGFTPYESLLAEVTSAPLPLLLALDQVQDPGNVGTLCRSLYALGGAGLVLPLHNSAYLGPAAHRSSAGALELLPVARVTNLGHALDAAEEAGLHIYGAGSPNLAGSLNAFANPMQLPAVLVLGNEDKGIRPDVLKRCAHVLHIPMRRRFDSLNVAQAGAALLALTAASFFREGEN